MTKKKIVKKTKVVKKKISKKPSIKSKKTITKKVKLNTKVSNNKPKTKKEKGFLPNITVIGVGGSGNNAINYMIRKDTKGVKFIAVNTDLQDLNKSKATKKIKIGQDITMGTGAGMNPEIGKQAAIEMSDELAESLKDTNLLFITCGMGGGTGTGAAPVIASIAKELGILSVAVVTKPFSFEGSKRKELAEEGIKSLSKHIDSYIVIENDKILETSEEDASLDEAFALSDEVLKQAVDGIADLINRPGIINIDYADVKATLEDSKLSLIGIGSAIGKERAKNAAMAAINSPLIDISTKGAGSILFSVISNGDLKMSEVSDIAEYITSEVPTDAIIKFGTAKNTKLKKGEIKVIVVASKFSAFKDLDEVSSFGLKLKQNNNMEEDQELIIDEFIDENDDSQKKNSVIKKIFKSFF